MLDWLTGIIHKPIAQFTLIDLGAIWLAIAVIWMIWMVVSSAFSRDK
jgi:hypothetical protein